MCHSGLKCASRANTGARAMDKRDMNLLRRMTKRVGVALKAQRANGTVRLGQGPGMFVLWEVAR